jgi:hypothetical protein
MILIGTADLAVPSGVGFYPSSTLGLFVIALALLLLMRRT